jgi:hypothetical protein
MEMPCPPTKMMEKISRAQKFAKSQRFATENLRRRDDSPSNAFAFSTKPLKFEMRDQL